MVAFSCANLNYFIIAVEQLLLRNHGIDGVLISDQTYSDGLMNILSVARISHVVWEKSCDRTVLKRIPAITAESSIAIIHRTHLSHLLMIAHMEPFHVHLNGATLA